MIHNDAIDIVYAVNNSGEELVDYIAKTRYVLPPDGKPYAIPKKMALQYLKHHALKIISDIGAYCQENNTGIEHLIIRDGGIGDLILLAPVLEQYKKENPAVILTIACSEDNMPVCESMPYIDKVVPITEGILRQYVWITDMRAYSELDPARTEKHRTDVYAQKFALKSFENKTPNIAIDRFALPYMRKDIPNVVVQGGTSHIYRDWPYTRDAIIALAEKYNVIVSDYRIRFDLPVHKNIVDMRNRTDVSEMMSCIAQSDLVVSPDSGGMHVALAAGVPAVCIFGIIRPDFRLRYYKTKYITFDKGDKCGTPHCGENHMVKCNAIGSGEYAKCMCDVSVDEVLTACDTLLSGCDAGARIVTNERKAKEYTHEIAMPDKEIGKLTLCCISQNEAKLAPIFIDRVVKHPLIGRTIIIDGGSTDGSDDMFRAAGCEVYHHPYNKDYHDMQAMQRNISCSYLHYNERAIIMDMDECFSRDLSRNLGFFLTTSQRYIEIPRRTYYTLAEADTARNQIKDYPDYQPRFFIWDHKYKWIRSPHHVIVNAPDPYRVKWDILHFEAEGKDRAALESKWASMQSATNKYYKERN